MPPGDMEDGNYTPHKSCWQAAEVYLALGGSIDIPGYEWWWPVESVCKDICNGRPFHFTGTLYVYVCDFFPRIVYFMWI